MKNCGKSILVAYILTLLAPIFVSCGAAGKNTALDEKTPKQDIVATILPIKYLIDSIIGDDFEVTTLVPPGASPETYEPTPAQRISVEKANMLIITGLLYSEHSLIERISTEVETKTVRQKRSSSAGETKANARRTVNLSKYICLIYSHIHSGSHHNHSHVPHEIKSGPHHDLADGKTGQHARGVDPHIWMSPKSLRRMAREAYRQIHELFPDSASYSANYEKLKARLQALDDTVTTRLALSPTRSFLIYHPGLTYFARDYGLQQISLENDSKEPTAKQLRQVIDVARAENITKIFYQSEFPQSSVAIIAAEIGAEPVEIDILVYDVVDNILKITDLITGRTPVELQGSASIKGARISNQSSRQAL